MARQAQLVVRVSSELAEDIDALAARLEPRAAYAPTGRMSRSDCVRLLLLRGLEVVTAELEELEGLEERDKK